MELPARLLDLPQLQRTGEVAVVPEQLVQQLRAERQERCEQHAELVDTTQRDVQDRSRPLGIGLDHRPRRLVAEVLVHPRCEAHGLREPGLEAGALDLVSDGGEARLDLRDDRRRPLLSGHRALGPRRSS